MRTEKTLAVIGDFYHPAEILREGLGAAARAGVDRIQFIDTSAAFDWDALETAGLLVLAKAGYEYVKPNVPDWMGANTGRLEKAVREGLGLVIVHSGLSGYEANPVMLRLAKACFVHHPHGLVGVSCVWDEGAELRPEGTTQETGGFPDEQYFLRFHETDTQVYMRTRSEGHGLAEGGWRHEHGLGRVVCLTPGHTAEAFADASYREALVKAMAWARRRE